MEKEQQQHWSERERIPQVVELLLRMQPEAVVLLYQRGARANSDFCEDLDWALDHASKDNLSLAQKVIPAFAASEDREARLSAVAFTFELAYKNRELGKTLWDQLLRDEDWEVRREAYGRLKEQIDSAMLHGADRPVANTALTWQDACELLRSHAEAERLNRWHQLGSVATYQAAWWLQGAVPIDEELLPWEDSVGLDGATWRADEAQAD